jgi:sugar/nucleoside kinase (ribokinase family)
MKTFTLDANIINLEGAADADMICFVPTESALLPCRAAWRSALIDALRRDVPITAIVKGFDGVLMPEEYDALCEALSYVSFIFVDSRSAEIFLKEPTDDPEAVLRAILKRFGVLSVILTDEGLAFDGEKITEFTEE